MAVTGSRSSAFDGKVWALCRIPFFGGNSCSSNNSGSGRVPASSNGSTRDVKSVSTVAKSLLPKRRRLRLDPSTRLYFPYEPGKQVRSAIRIKNTSKSHVAFKFQTTAPKSCFMRPPGGILSPGESIIATVFKFVEPPENNEKSQDRKSKVKFKIMSLKVKGPMEYVPELLTGHVLLPKVKRVKIVPKSNLGFPGFYSRCSRGWMLLLQLHPRGEWLLFLIEDSLKELQVRSLSSFLYF